MLHALLVASGRRSLLFLAAVVPTPLAVAQVSTAFDTSVTVSSNTLTEFDALVASPGGTYHGALVEWIDPAPTPPFGFQPDRVFLVKLDANGGVIWSRQATTTNPGTLVVASDAAGNSAIAGGSGLIDAFAPDGTPRWSATVPSCSSLVRGGLALLPGGGAVVAYLSGGTSWRVTTLGPTGSVVSSNVVATISGFLLFPTISARADGSVAGYTSTNVFLVDAAGAVAWSVPHGLSQPRAVDSGPAGEVVVAGIASSGFASASVFEPTGVLRWSHALSGPSSSSYVAADFDPWGGVGLAGSETSGGIDTTNGLATAIAANGTVLWTRTFAGPAGFQDAFDRVVVGRSGDVHALGFSKVSTASIGAFRLAHASWDRDGTALWQRVDPGPDFEEGSAYVEGTDGTLVSAGVVLGNQFLPQGIANVPSGAALLGLRPEIRATCFGDGVVAACPCGNASTPGAREGCRNSTGRGARLTATGHPSVAADTLQFTVVGTTVGAPSLFFQGSTTVASAPFGDGLRCAGGLQVRLYVKAAAPDTASAPIAGDASVSARAAAAGDVLAPGTTRTYQVAYRDTDLAFCAAPIGGLLNASNALTVVWTP